MQNQNNNGNPACASCKHQRKKCDEKCKLAPYFHADKKQEFLAAHKMYGVSKISKMLGILRQEDRKRAADSLVWEAFLREKDPVLGAYGEYRKAVEEVNLYKTRCQELLEELKLYKSQQSQQTQIQAPVAQDLAAAAAAAAMWNNINDNVMCINNGIGIRIGGGVSNTNTMNYIHTNGSYSSNHHLHHHMQIPEYQVIGEERDVGSHVVIVPPDQNSINQFNKQYFLPGQFDTIHAEPRDSTLWEGY